ncbi:uncharacterized protein NDAI_0B01160 [Naumovozyma dairenensis CBS 421]|uniref:CCHC-type domain-containing protein n=1 Tax=Naumovozyma dairenensis (strain ATCC 10597 / BCRC 20456 / CBS 421 / NBRC 0211 / NRRL Y-12639) TaxID=1071378 RepID=G0W5T9_NAUDC|nr:hypothetical protein NDAI_0B01160 [Naumovozyma dairenensis CBS 421]CCD23150.1 hypothetical protein NDAI_0B01160 [Naumovozyma dairenensis CBS 421]
MTVIDANFMYDANDGLDKFTFTGPTVLKGNAPATFSGLQDIMTLPTFLTTMKLQFITRSITTDSDKIAFFGRNLSGPAVNWFLHWFENAAPATTYETFLDCFRDHFFKRLDPNKIINEMNSISQAQLGVEQYNARFSQLWALMPPHVWTEQGAILAYLRGLSGDTARLVMLAHPKTLNEALEYAYETTAIGERFINGQHTNYVDADGDITMAPVLSPTYGHSVSAVYPRGNSFPNRNRSNGRYNNNYDKTHTRPRTTANYPKPNNSNPRYQHSGEISRNECIQRHLCFRCKRGGHSARECRAPQASNP